MSYKIDAKEFQKWVEANKDGYVSPFFAKYYKSEIFTEDTAEYELKAWTTKSGHVEVFRFDEVSDEVSEKGGFLW